jgi:hypothetical protein
VEGLTGFLVGDFVGYLVGGLTGALVGDFVGYLVGGLTGALLGGFVSLVGTLVGLPGGALLIGSEGMFDCLRGDGVPQGHDGIWVGEGVAQGHDGLGFSS